jgi:peptide/nickel transport system permease protein
MSLAEVIARKTGRTLLLLCLVAMGTVLLVRLAPGYFSDDREMDAKYAASARTELRAEQAQQGSLRSTAASMFGGWMHGDLGQSRQYELPVSELIRPRLRATLTILIHGIAYGWLLALCAALPLSTLRRGGTLFGAPFTLLLAVPTGAMATLCLLANKGGPVLVLALLLAARDFKFLQRVLRSAWQAPHLLQARAQGLRLDQLLLRHVLPDVLPQMLSLATLSIVTALSAIVPIEVIFAVPGIGQLAWSAAMNRDLPVLLAVTVFMATAVVFANLLSQRMQPMEAV